MDKSEQAITECSRELWGIVSKTATGEKALGFLRELEDAAPKLDWQLQARLLV